MLTAVPELASQINANSGTFRQAFPCGASRKRLASNESVTNVKSPKLAAAISVLVSFTLLAGCSSEPQLERDESATATLDYENVQVHRPLDEFKESDEQVAVIEKAVNIAIEPCLSKHGVPSRRDEPRVELEFRNYGLWNVERAKVYGSDFPRPELTEPTQQENEAFAACHAEAEGTTKLFRGDSDGQNGLSLAHRLDEEAYAAAIANPEWNAARDKWRQCITARGLTPNGDSWGSKQAAEISRKQAEQGITPELKQEDIRVSVIEAECNQSTNLTQTLANIEASYQAPLIRKNDAALQQEKQDIANRVELARKYIQEHP